MIYILILSVVVVIGYLILAKTRKLWPFTSQIIGIIKTKEQAIIDSLIYIPSWQTEAHPKLYTNIKPDDVVLQGINDAFNERIAKAKTLGWTQHLDPNEYTLLIFPSVRDYDDQGTYSPSFQVFLDPNSPYNGSVYDHGGYIYAAERCLTDSAGNLTGTFIIAANNSKEYTKTAVSNGLDHLFAWYNDRVLYEATKDHSKGGGHPLW